MKAALLTALTLFSVYAIVGQDESPPRPKVDEIYLARDDGEGKAGEQASEFKPTDIPIHCVVLLDRNGKATVKMNFVAVSVPGVKAESKVVSASYTTNERQNRVNFTGRPEDRWTPGRYRVDVFIDGSAAGKVEFDIKGAAAAVPANKYQPVKQRPRAAKKPT